MKILISGGTGLVGRALVKQWLAQGDIITILTRTPQQISRYFAPNPHLTAVQNLPVSLDDFDAVINLAGEPILAKRWTAAQKQRIWDSRLKMTEKLTALFNQSANPPACFISASASGYYGDCGDQPIDEQHQAAQNFAAQLCQHWEQAALKAKSRVCVLRTGLVLSPNDGALGKILPLYRCGLGGKLGSGRQFMPWIALEDMVNAIDFLLHQPQCGGAFNFSAPNPVRNAEFNQQLGNILHRPHFAHIPAFALKFILGESAHLLLDSQNMLPQKLLEQGFQFQYPHLHQYFAATFGKPEINV